MAASLMSRVFFAGLAVVTLTTLGAFRCISAEWILRAGQDSWHPVGLLSCQVLKNGIAEIHVFRITNGVLETLFTKRMPSPVRPPICLSNAIVVVGTDGVISKFDINGDLHFSGKVTGRAFSIGRLSDRYIFVTEVANDRKRKGLCAYLSIVDVSGNQPITKSQSRVIWPKNILQVEGEIVVVSPKKTQRLKIPIELE